MEKKSEYRIAPQTKRSHSQRLLSALFSEVNRTISQCGYDLTLEILRDGRRKNLNDVHNHDIAAKCVAECFEINTAQLLHSRAKKYPRRYAFGIWVSICVDDLGYSMTQLSVIYDKNISNLSRAKKTIQACFESKSQFNNLVQKKLEECRERVLKSTTVENKEN